MKFLIQDVLEKGRNVTNNYKVANVSQKGAKTDPGIKVCLGLLSVVSKMKCLGENNEEHGGKWNGMSHLFNQKQIISD